MRTSINTFSKLAKQERKKLWKWKLIKSLRQVLINAKTTLNFFMIMFMRVSKWEVNFTGIKMAKHLLSTLALKKQGLIKASLKTKCD